VTDYPRGTQMPHSSDIVPVCSIIVVIAKRYFTQSFSDSALTKVISQFMPGVP